MKYIPPKFKRLNEMASIDVGRLTEDDARAILEKIRWTEGIICPHCGSNYITRIKSSQRKFGMVLFSAMNAGNSLPLPWGL